MAEGFNIQGTGVQSGMAAASSQAADAAAKLPEAPKTEQAPKTASTQATTFTSEPAAATQVHSKVVSRLLEQGATMHSPGLARVPLPPRPEGLERPVPKKPAGPMTAPRSLDGGLSPLAPMTLWDARKSVSSLGVAPTSIPGQP